MIDTFCRPFDNLLVSISVKPRIGRDKRFVAHSTNCCSRVQPPLLEYYPPNATRVELYVVEPYWGSTAGHEYYNLESRLSPTNESGMCMLKFNSRLP